MKLLLVFIVSIVILTSKSGGVNVVFFLFKESECEQASSLVSFLKDSSTFISLFVILDSLLESRFGHLIEI